MTNTPRINRLSDRSQFRQTIVNAPAVDGLADFLEIGTGLEVETKNLDTTPLVLSLGLGYREDGLQLDEVKTISENVVFTGLPDDESLIYLYIDFTSGSPVFGNTLLAPEYLDDFPSVPAVGQFFYPHRHTDQGYVFNGSIWQPVKRMFVGTCSTASGVVTAVHSENILEKKEFFDGQERLTGETLNGRPVYRRGYEIESDITSNTTIATIQSELNPVNIAAMRSSILNVFDFFRNSFSSSDVSVVSYNKTSGEINFIKTGTSFDLGAGTRFELKYTK